MSFMAACIWAIILGSGLKPASARFAGRLRFELPMLVLTSPGQKTDTPMLVPRAPREGPPSCRRAQISKRYTFHNPLF